MTAPRSILAPDCQALVRAEAEKRGSLKAVASAIGYARPSLSLAMSGGYSGSVEKMAAAIRETFAGQIACPHLRADIPAGQCRDFRERPIPTADPRALKHWAVCQTCPNNPNRRPA